MPHRTPLCRAAPHSAAPHRTLPRGPCSPPPYPPARSSSPRRASPFRASPPLVPPCRSPPAHCAAHTFPQRPSPHRAAPLRSCRPACTPDATARSACTRLLTINGATRLPSRCPLGPTPHILLAACSHPNPPAPAPARPCPAVRVSQRRVLPQPARPPARPRAPTRPSSPARRHPSPLRRAPIRRRALPRPAHRIPAPVRRAGGVPRSTLLPAPRPCHTTPCLAPPLPASHPQGRCGAGGRRRRWRHRGRSRYPLSTFV